MENWDNFKILEKVYTVTLDLLFLLLPLLIMSVTYGMIIRTLYIGMQMDLRSNSQEETELNNHKNGRSLEENDLSSDELTNVTMVSTNDSKISKTNLGSSKNGRKQTNKRIQKLRAVRQSNAEKSLEAKKKVVRMLFIVVVEFFVCWTPLYVVQTWILFDLNSAYKYVGPLGVLSSTLYAVPATSSVFRGLKATCHTPKQALGRVGYSLLIFEHEIYSS
ncbi:unnamed protein product [Owenia fusiformis]|uniref:G-protein coupled receptors family 1 profile domain-containing protein n=1 Tax=Owenia fusiformis TaxID=6347 RepID=A0A8S4NB20_OWEFU|nr:unnamed protein product [Owenia fusiformis]